MNFFRQNFMSHKFDKTLCRTTKVQGYKVAGLCLNLAPTAKDRLPQQAVHQEMGQDYEPYFSESGHRFRPGRSAHQAVSQAALQEILQTFDLLRGRLG